MTNQIKLMTVNLVDKKDVEELIDLIETIESPIVDKLTALGFNLEDDMGEVEVTKGDVAIARYSLYVIGNEAFADVTMYDNQLSAQAGEDYSELIKAILVA